MRGYEIYELRWGKVLKITLLKEHLLMQRSTTALTIVNWIQVILIKIPTTTIVLPLKRCIIYICLINFGSWAGASATLRSLLWIWIRFINLLYAEWKFSFIYICWSNLVVHLLVGVSNILEYIWALTESYKHICRLLWDWEDASLISVRMRAASLSSLLIQRIYEAIPFRLAILFKLFILIVSTCNL